MGVRMYRVQFGWNIATFDVVADTIPGAMIIGTNKFRKSMKEQEWKATVKDGEDWISSVECIAEEDP